jgi:lipoate-protein ligase A
MLHVGTGQSPPTLRLYQWDPPTISLGYFQPYAQYKELPPPAGRLPVVRRPTGGGAILHDLELTYSLTLPTDHPLIHRNPNRLYELAHDAIINCLSSLGLNAARCGLTDDSGAARGPFFCFQRRHCYDLLLDGDKIAGSAQRRTRHAILQHGSIVLANRFSQHPTAFAPGPGPTPSTPGIRPESISARATGPGSADPDPAAVQQATSEPPRLEDQIPPMPGGFREHLHTLRERLPASFAAWLGLTITPGCWTPEELALAEESHRKFAGADWTHRA